MGIDAPIVPQPPDPPQPSPTPTPPGPDNFRRLVNTEPSPSNRRSSQTGQDRSGTLIHIISIDLDSNRVALLSPEGPPVRGDVSTDLAPKFYTLSVDLSKKQWVFGANEVNTGLRFYVVLDGAEPFNLVYPSVFPLVAQRGFQSTGPETFSVVKARVTTAVSDQRYVDAYAILDLLGEVDLYDILDELWLDEPGVVNALLLNFMKVLATKQFDMFHLLRALETFAVDKSKLYVDTFDKCFVHPTSFSKDAEREKLGKTNIKLVFTYALMPERAIMIYADDISDSQTKSNERPQYGEGALLYPSFFNAATTPQMWAEKKKKIAEIEVKNIEFFKTAYKPMEDLIIIVMFISGWMMGTLPLLIAAPRLLRPITNAFKNQPGRWLPDFEGGLNMSEEAAAYQARVCHTDRGWGYRRNGLNFDGYDQDKLIDAKYYPEGNKMTNTLARNSYWAGNHHLEVAAKQLKAAGGIPVEWRVAGQTATSKLQELFRVNNIPIKVVFIP